MDQQKNAEGLAWQISVWDRMVPVYVREIDKRFEPIVEHVVKRADLKSGQHALDLGTGTGSVALRAAEAIAPNGRVTAVDISPDMLAVARRRAASTEANITFVEGRAEAIPADAENIDAVLASLSLMYVIDRSAAAREIARVLRPDGRPRPRGCRKQSAAQAKNSSIAEMAPVATTFANYAARLKGASSRRGSG